MVPPTIILQPRLVPAQASGAMFGGRWLAALIVRGNTSGGIMPRDDTFAISLVVSVLAALAASVYFWAREREAQLGLVASQEREQSAAVSRQLAETELQLLRSILPHEAI